MEPSLASYLALSGILFTIGTVGVIFKRNAIGMFMCIELMLNAVNLTLVTFNRMRPEGMGGQMFAFFLIAAEAAEVAVGLAIVLSMFRIRRTVRSDDADLLRN